MLHHTKPMEHQLHACEFILDLHERGQNFGALFMDMGTGKSKTIIDIVSMLFQADKIDAVMLVAPNGVHAQWYSEQIVTHTPVFVDRLIWKSSKSVKYVNKVKQFLSSDKMKVTLKKKLLSMDCEEERSEKATELLSEISRIVKLNQQKLRLEAEANGFTYEEPTKKISQRVDAEERCETDWEEQTHCLKWLCVNVERFQSSNGKDLLPFIDYVKNNRVAIIVDEATVIKNHKANRSVNLQKIGRLATYKYILTGSPITNSVLDVWSMFNFLNEDFWGCNYFIFSNRYSINIKDTNRSTGFSFQRKANIKDFQRVRELIEQGSTDEDISCILNMSQANVAFLREHPSHNKPFKKIEEIKNKISPYSYTIRKDQCLDLPEKIYELCVLEMSTKQKELYNTLVKKYLAMYEGKELSVQNKVALTMRLQQIAGGFFPYGEVETLESGTMETHYNAKQIEGTNPKLKKIVEDLNEVGDYSVIIWARYVAEIELLRKELTKTFQDKIIEVYYGGVSSKRREEIKKDFQSGYIDVLIINQQAGSMGLNLQNSYLNYYYSNSYSLLNRVQSEDRTHRIGQTNSVIYKDLIMKDTVDEKILLSLKGHKEVLDYFKGQNLHDLLT